MKPLVLLLVPLALAACSSLVPSKLPDALPPLADMEEPLALAQAPEDEAARKALPLGGFTGVTVADARRSLDEMENGKGSVRVSRVVENSPADAAGVEEGDLVVEVVDAAGRRHPIEWTSQWREAEIAAQPGTTLRVVVDRAGAERTLDVGVVARVRVPDRQEGVRLREEERVGVVLRSATEVEARAAGLGPGGGAVVVGLAGGSPWRAAGLRFGDLLVSVDGREVAHPQVVLDAIREAEKDARLDLVVLRGGRREETKAPLTRREREMTSFHVPLLVSYEDDRGREELSAVLGLFRYRETLAAWDVRLLWLISFGGGDADRLVEVKR